MSPRSPRSPRPKRAAASPAPSYPGDVLIETDDVTYGAYYVPVDLQDLAAIEADLERRAPFCTGFCLGTDPLEHPYRAVTYRHQHAVFGTECRALVDRNIVTRLVRLAQRRDPTPNDRLAAAAVCFAQCADVLIDPGMALREYAAHDGGGAAVAEVDAIRVLDNVAPQFLADIALGRRQRLPAAELRRACQAVAAPGYAPVAPERLEQPLRDFRLNYIVLLRIAALELSAMSGARRAATLLDWVHHEFQWSAVAVWFGLRHFAPKLPATGWLPGLRSREPAAALASVRNVAWDLTLVSTWLARKREQREQNVLWLLCSFDRAVVEIARGVLIPPVPGDDDSADEDLPRLLRTGYGQAEGRRLTDQYGALVSRRRDPGREYNRCRGQFPEDLRVRLEHEVLGAVPRSARR